MTGGRWFGRKIVSTDREDGLQSFLLGTTYAGVESRVK